MPRVTNNKVRVCTSYPVYALTLSNYLKHEEYTHIYVHIPVVSISLMVVWMIINLKYDKHILFQPW